MNDKDKDDVFPGTPDNPETVETDEPDPKDRYTWFVVRRTVTEVHFVRASSGEKAKLKVKLGVSKAIDTEKSEYSVLPIEIPDSL